MINSHILQKPGPISDSYSSEEIQEVKLDHLAQNQKLQDCLFFIPTEVVEMLLHFSP